MTAQTFADPPKSVRPMYYWWMPVAQTDDQELTEELHQMAEGGAGGAIIAATKWPTDPAKYGWGTPEWAHKVQVMLAAAKKYGLELDFSQGPSWPAMVPSVTDVNDPRSAQQLIFSHEFHAGGSSRDGALPDNFDVKPPKGADKTLVAAVVARCEESTCDSQTGSPRLLDPASVKDVTAQVDEQGSLHYDFPGDSHSTYALMAFYQTSTGQARKGYSAEPMYELDNLSVAGAKATTDYFDQHIITPQAQQLIDAIGKVGWYENSLEPGTELQWTWDFAKQWQQRRGYPVARALPALTTTGIGKGFPGEPMFDFGDGVGQRMRTDYVRTESDLYIHERLKTLNEWAHGHGIHTDAQPYGPPVDTPVASANLDVPGGESHNFGDDGSGKWLAFGNNVIEEHKTTAVGAHMNGTSLVDLECCALQGSVWGSRAATRDSASHVANLQGVNDGLAGGATRVVWHGFPYLYGVKSPGTEWPGATYGGPTSYAEAYGPNRNPTWSDYQRINDHVSRLGLVLRQGKPRFDVAVYWQDVRLHGNEWTVPHNPRLIPSSSALTGAGYTSEYVSPDFLRSSKATYRNGRLFPEQSAYKALVLNDQATMPVDIAQRILARARQGLPVVIVGGLPRTTPGDNDAASQDAQLRGLVDQLVAQPTVTRVAHKTDIPAALEQAGVRAAAAHATLSPNIVSVRRHTSDADYYFLYNQTPTAADQTVALTGHGLPYRMNTWTGRITRITDYTSGNGTITVPVHLHGHDTTVVALAAPGNPVFAGAPAEPRPNAPAATATLAPRTLTDWSLSVDSWTPDASDRPGATKHTELGPVSPAADSDGTLPAWTGITPAKGYSTDLKDVSGIGTYTTRVRLGPDWSLVKGAQLSLGDVVDTAQVAVNGHSLPPLDQTDLQHIDIGSYLHQGDNTITVRVASTLLNAVRVAPDSGAAGRARIDYGLLGPVKLTPVTPVAVESLEDDLPLAAGGYNQAQIRVTNNTRHAQRIALAASASDGITADLDQTHPTVAPGESVTVNVDLRDTGLAAGTSTLKVTARGEHGAEADASVRLRHSDDLARNDIGTQYPRVFAPAFQDSYPPSYANDGTQSTFFVSGWQPPSAANPVLLGVDLGAPTEMSSVEVVTRAGFGPTTYDIQTSNDGRSWTTVASVHTSTATTTTAFPSAHGRYVRLRITQSARSGHNAQVRALQVHA